MSEIKFLRAGSAYDPLPVDLPPDPASQTHRSESQ
jgi:hypothetical protein